MVFHLEPVFEPLYPGGIVDAGISISLEHTQINYPANYATLESSYESTQGAANPIEIGNDGLKPAGKSRLNWSYSFEYSWDSQSNGKCMLGDLNIKADLTTILPAPDRASWSLEGREAYWDVVHHEGGHLRIYRAFFEGIKNAVGPLVSGIPNTGMIDAEACGAALTSLFKDVYDKQFQVAIAEADSLHSYNTGITWGSCDPPNPYMNETCPDGM